MVLYTVAIASIGRELTRQIAFEFTNREQGIRKPIWILPGRNLSKDLNNGGLNDTKQTNKAFGRRFMISLISDVQSQFGHLDCLLLQVCACATRDSRRAASSG